MKKSLYFRLVKEYDKELSLHRCILDLVKGRDHNLTHSVNQETFSLVPSSPISYWVSDAMRRMFKDVPLFESNAGLVKSGLNTSYDLRFLRLWWEINFSNIANSREETFNNKPWVLFAKGGEYSPYYADIHLVINWGRDGEILRTYEGAYIRNEGYYFRPGLTYPLATVKGFNVRLLPHHCIFGHKGPGIFILGNVSLYSALGFLNSRLCQHFLLLQTPSRSWEVGYVQNIPWIAPLLSVVGDLAKINHDIKRELDKVNETSHTFTCSTLLGLRSQGLQQFQNHNIITDGLEQRFLSWLFTRDIAEANVTENSHQIDQAVLELYGITERDQRTIDRELRPHPGSYPHKDEWRQDEDEKLRLLYLTKEVLPEESNEEDIQDDDDYADYNQRRSRRVTYRTLEEIAHELKIHPASIAARRQALGLYRPEEFREAVADLISYCVGCLFSRWDIRIGAGELEPPPLPDPEEGLPLYPPGALRPDSPPLEAKGALAKVIEHSAGRGILVDDPGHQHDLVAGVEACLSYLFGEDKLPAIRGEIKEALGRDLRSWLARSFFPFHIKRYSKSRRKAPIYWQLSTPGKGYSLWLYYHAIGADTLYTAVREYVSPKTQFEEQRLAELKRTFERLKTSGTAREARSAEKAVEDQEGFLQELYAFRSELQRLADWGYNPDLNDGVIINIAPLHRLVPWHEAEKYWEQLVQGEYDWSSMSKNLYRK
jgi:hypothetical protein